jgi:hypothetical protein
MPTVEIYVGTPLHFEHIEYARCSKQYCEHELFFPI